MIDRAVLLPLLIPLRVLAPLLAVMLSMASFARAADRDDSLSPEGVNAVKRGLTALAITQRPDGSWPGSFGGTTGITAACAIGMMAQGQVPGEGEFGPVVAKALGFLVKSARSDGLIWRPGSQGGPMYHHGLATLALAEAWGMSQDRSLRDVLKRAVDLIIATQNAQGGWRYEARISDADLSATVMQLMALRAAKDAGIAVPKETIDLGLSYVKSCHNSKNQGKDGGFAYQPGQASGFARSGAGILSLLVSGDYKSNEVSEGVAYLLQFRPVGQSDPGEEYWFYGMYYATNGLYQAQALGAAGARAWRAWWPAITAELVKRQDPRGFWSWQQDQYSSAMALIILGVPNRYLPVYQR